MAKNYDDDWDYTPSSAYRTEPDTKAGKKGKKESKSPQPADSESPYPTYLDRGYDTSSGRAPVTSDPSAYPAQKKGSGKAIWIFASLLLLFNIVNLVLIINLMYITAGLSDIGSYFPDGLSDMETAYADYQEDMDESGYSTDDTYDSADTYDTYDPYDPYNTDSGYIDPASSDVSVVDIPSDETSPDQNTETSGAGVMDDGDTAARIEETATRNEAPAAVSSEELSDLSTIISEVSGVVPDGVDMSLVNPDFKASMDSYEQFFDDYFTFMDAYERAETTDQTSVELLGEYITAYAENMNNLKEIDYRSLSPEDAAYYVEVTNRIYDRLERSHSGN